jgi:hypothetical protein
MKTLVTDQLLRGLKPAPTGTRTVVWDSIVPGLCIRITDKGSASFCVMRRVKGQSAPARRMLGVAWHVPFPASHPLPYPLATAREDARAMIIDMSRGIDPKTQLAAKNLEEVARQANCFETIAESFIQKHVRGLKSGAEIERVIRRELIGKWGKRSIAEITKRDVVELIEAVATDGRKYQALKIFAFASKLFSWGAPVTLL